MVIAGMSRSGTTVLKNLCNTHPDIWITSEFRNFLCLGARYPRHIYKLRRHRWHGLFYPSAYPLSDAESRVRNVIFFLKYASSLLPHIHKRIDAEVLRQVLHHLQPQKAVVGDKFPYYLWQLERFTQIPNMFPVVIYRDCRDVVYSTLTMVQTRWAKMPFARSLDTPEKIARLWVEGIQMMERCASRAFLIRYEALVTDPAPILKKLEDWLGTKPNGCDYKLVHAASIGKYKQGLSLEQINLIEAIAGETLVRLGYL